MDLPLTQGGAFPEAERRHLLSSPGLGPVVVQRLETLGVTSLDSLRQHGVDRVVERLCRDSGTVAWRNRRRALNKALSSFG